MNEPDKTLKELVSRTRNNSRRDFIINLVLTVVGLLFGWIGSIFGGNGSQSGNALSPFEIFLSIAVGVGIAALGAVIQVYLRNNNEKLKRKQQIEDKRSKLAQTHPELVDLLEILEYNEATTGGRSFWSSFAQNVFFLGLGVALPIAIQRLHWFQ
jgi:uncharacterized membrane protein YsdA (DUF1294 family)